MSSPFSRSLRALESERSRGWPSGLFQTIGETGWQLSHGERSRIFLARALLQKPDVLILDESFAQLDPENMKLAIDAVAARDSAVLLIAHP